MTSTLVASHGPGHRGSHGGTPNVPPAFRLRRAPALEPPFDEERDADDVLAGWTPRTSSLASQSEPSAVAASRSSAVISATDSGLATAAASRYVQVCLEVLNGYRPPSHLRTLAGPIEFADVIRHLRLRRNGAWRAGGGPNAHGEGGLAAAERPRLPVANEPGAATRPVDVASGRRVPGIPPTRPVRADRLAMAPPNRFSAPGTFRLLRLRVSEPAPGKAEVVAVIAYGGASIAIAMRLEARNASWVCTVFQVV